MDPGAAVTVTLDGDAHRGTVLERTYTPKEGRELLAVALEDPLPDGRERIVVTPESVSPSA